MTLPDADGRAEPAPGPLSCVIIVSADGPEPPVDAVLNVLGAPSPVIRRGRRGPRVIAEWDESRLPAAEAGRRLVEAGPWPGGVEVFAVPGELRRADRRLIVTDVDSTLITAEVIELLAARSGSAERVAAITDRAMRGELDFAASLHERVATLAGLPAAVIDEVIADVVLTEGARELAETVRAADDVIGVVSGGFAEVVEPLATELGIRHVRANRLEVVDGRLTGRVLGDVVDRAAKARALAEFCAIEGIDPSATVAVGDGANDLDMLSAAGLGIAFHAKPMVRAQSVAAIDRGGLDRVLDVIGTPPLDPVESDSLSA